MAPSRWTCSSTCKELKESKNNWMLKSEVEKHINRKIIWRGFSRIRNTSISLLVLLAWQRCFSDGDGLVWSPPLVLRLWKQQNNRVSTWQVFLHFHCLSFLIPAIPVPMPHQVSMDVINNDPALVPVQKLKYIIMMLLLTLRNLVHIPVLRNRLITCVVYIKTARNVELWSWSPGVNTDCELKFPADVTQST